MLSGTADPEIMARSAPAVTYATEPLAGQNAELLQVIYEVDSQSRQAMLPPALHPVSPAVITFTVLTVGQSSVGPFAVAEIRIVCRSGVRSRGFHVSCFVDGARAGELLAGRWGYRVRPAEVRLSRRYHGIRATVRCDRSIPLDAGLLYPQPLSPGDVQFTDTMHLVRTSAGSRLIQVERSYQAAGVERGRPTLASFDPTAWGEQRLVPAYPVSAVYLAGEVTFRPIRYLCRPEVSALEGTERIG
jgi:Acetoacetate decarboxylase (ADC)